MRQQKQTNKQTNKQKRQFPGFFAGIVAPKKLVLVLWDIKIRRLKEPQPRGSQNRARAFFNSNKSFDWIKCGILNLNFSHSLTKNEHGMAENSKFKIWYCFGKGGGWGNWYRSTDTIRNFNFQRIIFPFILYRFAV